MSNIYTEFARLYFRPGVIMTAPQAEDLLERILDERGSYWVPVTYELAWPSHIDYQYGSGKGAGLYHLDEEDFSLFEEIWVRLADEGSDQDVIFGWSPLAGEVDDDARGRRRPCRYAFDEIAIFLQEGQREAWVPSGLPWKITAQGYRAACFGTYLTLNERQDMDLGPRARFHTPRNPSDGFSQPSRPIYDLVVPALPTSQSEISRFLTVEQRGIERIEMRQKGRTVHIAQWGPHHHDEEEIVWQHRSGDDWDNCADDEFVRLRKLISLSSHFPSPE
jgi:hypothetical protein